MIDNKILNMSIASGVDGSYGSKTKDNLSVIKTMDVTTNILFKIAILNRMKTYYINLATKKPDKYLKYLKGWDNRVNNLI